MRAVNLIPADQRSGASAGAGRSEGVAYALLGLLGGLALLGFLYGRAEHQISSSRTQAAQITSEAQTAQAQATQLAPYASFTALREQREQAVLELVNTRFDWAHALHELGRVLPRNAAITSLAGTVGSASSSSSSASSAAKAATSGSVTSATPPGSVPTFLLSGCATSQQAVALMLDRLRLVDGVREVTLQSSTKGASSGSGGGCSTGQPVFAVDVTFAGLPTPATSPASAATTELTAGSATSTGSAR